MITKKDTDIINYIYSAKFATIEQIGYIFFNHSKYAYDMARRELNKILREDKYIRMFRNTATNQNVYVPIESSMRKLSLHNIKAMDYLARLKNLGVELEKVEVEKEINGVIPDLYVIFKFNGARYRQVIEIQTRHEVADINKYIKIENILNELAEGHQTDIIVVQNTNKNYSEVNETNLKVIQLDLDLTQIAKVLL
ncbi:MAG: hypothetical protein ACRDDY_08340 [Clostridium sp.]|uniref:hypothetical protein n=1 Tax=Clostridium sp. TaxID=1506 RepID=UPI003EE526EE